MFMRNRIKEVRKKLGLTQAEFGVSLGFASTSAASWEKTNPQIPSALALQMMSKIYNINIHWLETGEGEMFNADAEAPLNDYPPIIRAILRSYNRLNPAEQAAFCKFLDGVIDEYGQSDSPPAVDPFTAAEAAAVDPAQSRSG